MPRSAKLASGLSPGVTSFDASSADRPVLMPSTSRLDQLPSPLPLPMGDAAAKLNPRQMPAEATIAPAIDEPASGLNSGQAPTVELGTISAAAGQAAPPPAPQIQLPTAPAPRGVSLSSRSPPSRKPLERRPSNTRTAQRHAPVNAIEDVLQKHSRVLK
jgi:hypothetical protein